MATNKLKQAVLNKSRADKFLLVFDLPPVLKNINKPFARKIQILTVMEQRAKVAGKTEQAAIAKRGKEAIRKQHGKKTTTAKKKT